MSDDRTEKGTTRCPDGWYRGCNFMGCDDAITQRIEFGRVVLPCRNRSSLEPSSGSSGGDAVDD